MSNILTRIAFVTMSFYKPEWAFRFACACKNTFELSVAGIDHFNLDDSPDPTYRGILQKLGACVDEAPKGIGPSKREGVRWARSRGNDLIVMGEIEKFGLAEHIPNIMTMIADGTYDIVHFCRDEAGWESYPEFQRNVERDNAKFYAETLGITGVETDTWMGPVGFSGAMADTLVSYEFKEVLKKLDIPDDYLNIYFPVFAMRVLGARVGFVKVPGWIYPPEQKLAEEGIAGPEMERRRTNQMKIRDGVTKLAGLKPSPVLSML